MRTLIITMIFLMHSMAGCAQQNFKWLLGTWKLKDKPVYEEWRTDTGGDLKGLSFKVNGSDTVVLERINLTFRSGKYHYIPEVAENAAPVDFTFTSFDEDSFIAENPQHDFPKLIRYTIVRKDEQEFIEASIEGNGKVISYAFEKIR
jgi:hypothetical protein